MTASIQGIGDGLLRLVPWRLRSFNNLVLASPNRFFSGVLSTPPQPVDPASTREVHALACSRDVNMLLTSVKSLLRHCPPVALILHDDGSLTEADLRRLREHLPGVRIISREEADAAMRAALPPDAFEKRSRHFFLLKLFDFNHFNRGTHTLMLDSDIVFLRRPDEVVRWLQTDRPAPFYNRDWMPSYRAARVPEGVSLPPNLNAGFLGYAGQFALQDIVRWCRDLDYWMEDQTIYAVLLANQDAKALEPEQYRVYMGEKITDRTVMIHFISPKRFERLLYPRLARRVFRDLRARG